MENELIVAVIMLLKVQTEFLCSHFIFRWDGISVSHDGYFVTEIFETNRKTTNHLYPFLRTASSISNDVVEL